MKRNIILLMVLFLLKLSPVFGGIIIKAEGVSFFEKGLELMAKEKALDDAKRNAVEKAFGSSIESKTMVSDYEVMYDQITSRSSGYISNLKIIDEKKTDLGTYEVSIEAEVEVKSVVDDFGRFRKIISWQKNPRVSIIIEPGIDQAFIPAANRAIITLTNKLKENGFTVFRDSEKSGLQMGLFVRISLEVSTTKGSFQGLDLPLNEISLTANIVRPGDFQIIATSSDVKSIGGVNKLKALDKGTIQCVGSIWEDLKDQLTDLWESELYNDREISLSVLGVENHSEALNLSGIFSGVIKGVSESSLVSFNALNGEYLIRFRGWPEHFINELGMTYFKKKYFSHVLLKAEGNRLIIKVEK